MWRRVTVVVLCSSLMSACGTDDGENGDTGGTTTTTIPTTRSHLFTDSDCTDADYPVPLGVETDDPEEIDYLDDVVACADTSLTNIWLLNNSDAVWEIYLGSEVEVIEGEPTAFRTMFGGTAFAPGDAVGFPSYEQYEWHVNPGLSATWVGFDLVRAEFARFGEEAAAEALDKRSPFGAAVLLCGLAFKDAASVDGSDDVEEVLVDVFEAGASGAQCRESVGSLTYTNKSGQQATVLEDLTRLKGETAIVERASARLTYASRAAKFGKFLLQLK